MSTYLDIIDELKAIAQAPNLSVAKIKKESGKKVFGCFPIYTPEEIVYAAGAIPVGMWGGSTELSLVDKYLQAFCCSIMRSNMEYGMKGTYNILEGIMLPTFCDTLKCICENWKVAVPQLPILPIVYPQHRRIEAGLTYLKDELERVRGEIGSLLEVTITDEALENAFEVYEDYRSTMRTFVQMASEHPGIMDAATRHLIIKAGWFMDKKDYTAKIKQVITELKALERDNFKGTRVVATGLLAEPLEILSLLKKYDIAIVADDLAQESRQYRVPSRQEGSAIEKIAYRTVDQRGCTFLYEEEKSRGQMLIDMVKANKADAAIVFMMKFCDPEEFDYPVYKVELEAAGIPILYLEIEQQMDAFGQMETRIQSFAEMLQ